jgi:hypothetical protein
MERNDDQRLGVIPADYQKVGSFDPRIQLAKSTAAAFDFDAAINAEQRDGKITAETAARGPAEGHTLGGKASTLQGVDERALGAIALFSRSAATGHGSSSVARLYLIERTSRPQLGQTTRIDVLLTGSKSSGSTRRPQSQYIAVTVTVPTQRTVFSRGAMKDTPVMDEC